MSESGCRRCRRSYLLLYSVLHHLERRNAAIEAEAIRSKADQRYLIDGPNQGKFNQSSRVGYRKKIHPVVA